MVDSSWLDFSWKVFFLYTTPGLFLLNIPNALEKKTSSNRALIFNRLNQAQTPELLIQFPQLSTSSNTKQRLKKLFSRSYILPQNPTPTTHRCNRNYDNQPAASTWLLFSPLLDLILSRPFVHYAPYLLSLAASSKRWRTKAPQRTRANLEKSSRPVTQCDVRPKAPLRSLSLPHTHK